MANEDMKEDPKEEEKTQMKETCDCGKDDCEICQAKMKKGEAGGENPSEGAASGTDANSSVSPNMGVPSTQNVAHGSSGISVGREASSGSSAGQSPAEVAYLGKSADNSDLMKSPLFTELSKQLGELSKSVAGKLDSIEKSVNDRIANVQKKIADVEKFYTEAPLYKALNETGSSIHTNSQPVQKSLKEKVQSGEVRYSF